MNFITKKETEQKDLISNFSISNNELVVKNDCNYKSEFEIGDIVTYKNDTTKVGLITFVEEDEITILFKDSSEDTISSDDLIIIPPTIGLLLINDSNLLSIWEELSNGKSEDFDLKCLYIGDVVINEVPFIKAFKNTTTIVDNKFRRNFSLYRKFGSYKIFRTNLYTISNNNIGLDSSRYVYYLLEDNTVYYLGIDLNSNDLSVYLFNR